jgi:hypothetical protein
MSNDEISRWMGRRIANQPQFVKDTFCLCHVLWNMFDQAPRLTDSGAAAQATYFRGAETSIDLTPSLIAIYLAVKDICKSAGATVADVIAKEVIPMLIFTMQAGFLTSGSQRQSTTDPFAIQFVDSHVSPEAISIIAHLSRCVDKLIDFLIKFDDSRRIIRHRTTLKGNNQDFYAMLVGPPDPITSQSQRVQFLMNKDTRAKEQRQKEIDERKAAQDRQMELFLQSVKGFGRTSR